MNRLDNLGRYRYPLSTVNQLVYEYFNQGLILGFGFNHAEAARSFRAAYQLDPECALCYWGEALVLGPNINAPMDDGNSGTAYSLVQKALKFSVNTNERELALISALNRRYQHQAPDDRSALDNNYAQAMHQVYSRFPDDALIASLYAEALMDLHPWDFWTLQGIAKPWTDHIVTVLEKALQLDPNHPLANHLYIHIMEASPFAFKALPSAERLAWLVPGSGHLTHMPAHIYIRTGRYKDAITANQHAVKVDSDYLQHQHEESLYTQAYVPHNHHFLWAAAIKIGRRKLALQAASHTAGHVSQDSMLDPAVSGTMQHFYVIPMYTQALFGEWQTILELESPSTRLKYPMAIWHYARGLAFLRRGQKQQAELALSKLKLIRDDPSIQNLTIFDLNKVSSIVQIAVYVLEAEIAASKHNYSHALDSVRKAVVIEDLLNYTEPKDWYLPPRQVLGAILLEAGQAQQAEAAYREDLEQHPQNGWSLFGLFQSLQQQGKSREAEQIYKQFKEVWSESDVNLKSSRF
ncbi:MAG: hypothetical protein K0U68_16805 [Gammaproteobacteria bacterium]|nr:hypothetical protein [Gammaproteobacteria bacterium]